MSLFHRYRVPLFILVFLLFFSSNFAYAMKRYVNPGMSRGFIQAVIDAAKDGDVIFFKSGTYDFSDTPPNWNYETGGALQIRDKSLTIKGAPGAILLGSPLLEYDPTGAHVKGTTCFWVFNPSARKDVCFDGLTIRTFMWGILTDYCNGDPNNPVDFQNLRNLVIRNCAFTDMKRHGIIAAGVQGNITIANNRLDGDIAQSKRGIEIDWFTLPGNMEFQPKHTIVTIDNNSIRNFGWCGVFFTNATNVLVNNNTISTDISSSDTNRSHGINFSSGLRATARISNNVLSNLDWGIHVWGGTWPITSGNQYPATGIRIKDNVLSSIRGWGIIFEGDLAYSNTVANNMIEMPLEDSVAIYSEGFSNQYKNNIIRGSGCTAAYLSGHPDDQDLGLETYAHNEHFRANSIAGISLASVHYFLDLSTHNNTIIGLRTECATYEDWGADNIFRYVYPYSSSSGMAVFERLSNLGTRKTPRERAETRLSRR